MKYLNDGIIKLEDLAQMINFATRLVAQLQEQPELFEKYNEHVTDLVGEYNTEVDMLKKDLERYFEMERRHNYPVNLSLHRAYENLRNL